MLLDETYYSQFDIDDFEDFSDYSKYFISKFVTPEEIQNQEHQYVLESLGYPWADAIANNGSVYKMVSEGLYHSWPGKKVKYMFFSKKRDSVAFEADERAKIDFANRNNAFRLNWKDYLVCSEVCAASEIVHKFKLSPWQLGVEEQMTGDCRIFVIVPDMFTNVQYITDAMKTFGYFLQRKYMRSDIGEKWLSLEFGMNKQTVINEMLSERQWLYHIAPGKYDGKILKNGLVPKNKNVLYEYPDRIYLFDVENIEGEEVLDLNAEDFRMPIRFLFHEKQKSDSKYVDDNIFSVWRVSVQDILNKVNFCVDFTQDNIEIPQLCVFVSLYTEDNISPLSIEKMFSVDMTTRK